MSFYDHLETFVGQQVYDFEPAVGLLNPGGSMPESDADSMAPRVRFNYDNNISVTEQLTALVGDPEADKLTALVIGAWWDDESRTPDRVVELLVSAAAKLPSLRAIFFGDIISEDCELSWIQNTDMSPLWNAFPQLETLHIRGGNELSLGHIEHGHLRELVIQTGGMPANILTEICRAQLPQLEHLQLYLGDSGYGWTGQLDDLKPLIRPDLFPELHYLGLCNAEISDAIAQWLAEASLPPKLKTLDLSLGSLGDEGAESLLNSTGIRQLTKLDFNRHYISPEMCERLKALPMEVDVSNAEGAASPDDRYVALGE